MTTHIFLKEEVEVRPLSGECNETSRETLRLKQTELSSSASHEPPGPLTAVELTAGAATALGFIRYGHASQMMSKPPGPIHMRHVLLVPPPRLQQLPLSSYFYFFTDQYKSGLLNVQLKL